MINHQNTKIYWKHYFSQFHCKLQSIQNKGLKNILKLLKKQIKITHLNRRKNTKKNDISKFDNII